MTYIDALTTSLGLQEDGGGGIADVEKRLLAAAKTTAGAAEVVIVLDGLDFLLAATEAGVGEVLDMVSALREVCKLVFCLFIVQRGGRAGGRGCSNALLTG